MSSSYHASPCRADVGCAWWLLCQPSPKVSSATHQLFRERSRVAKRLNKLWRRRGQVFPDRYHSRILKTPRECRIALIYVLQNARKHGSWRAAMPDVYSSGPLFDGWSSTVETGARSSRSYVGKPRTWLLAVGWKRYGLINPKEVPKAAA